MKQFNQMNHSPIQFPVSEKSIFVRVKQKQMRKIVQNRLGSAKRCGNRKLLVIGILIITDGFHENQKNWPQEIFSNH